MRGKPPFVHWCNRVVKTAWFDNFIIAVIVGNTLTLSMDYYNMPDDLIANLAIANIVFSTVFLAEMVLKLTGACLCALCRDGSAPLLRRRLQLWRRYASLLSLFVCSYATLRTGLESVLFQPVQ